MSKRRISARTMRLMDLFAGFPRPPKPPKSFTRSELIRTLYERFEANGAEGQEPRHKGHEEGELLLNCLLDEIAGALERGTRVALRGLGALSVREKRKRQGCNPRTGEALIIDARRIVRFRASGLLLARVNRRTNQRPERAKPDPRQLSFPIDDQQEERGDTEPVTAPPLPVGGRKTGRKKERLMKKASNPGSAKTSPAQKKPPGNTGQPPKSPGWSRVGRNCGAAITDHGKLAQAADKLAEAAVRLSAAAEARHGSAGTPSRSATDATPRRGSEAAQAGAAAQQE
jgi:integration host factor subunit beta